MYGLKRKLIVLASLIFVATGAHAEPPVKLSKSKICHATDSKWYKRTKNYTSYDSLDECLKVGRLPKGYIYKGNTAIPPKAVSSSGTSKSGKYDRDYFGSWIDDDGDCQNTRHELLAKLSTQKPNYTSNGCRVVRGRWLDPYTDRVYLESKNLDVDHLVPLKWAWDHGANTWSKSKRVQFANDERNLFAVDAGENRAKSAQSPLTWMPPNTKFHCEYMTRFKRVVLIYKLQFTPRESQAYNAKMTQVCG
ncbi:HNH endonuclease family protein [Flexibacterium corallicola]|uniref:HNH endonuclease family protein n=1 Tax=Flexibacterium corallicola TaxID=3037259 RepID=UPI00286F2AA7|nr:HNH endonuclease family protein [Pseudovibrio sp. M1P-2-3]